MSFKNPIVGTEDLLRPAVRSPNFLAGSAGWRIAQNGGAEFNSVTVRGSVLAGDLTMTTGGRLRSAASGARLEIGGAGGISGYPSMQFYDSGGVNGMGIAGTDTELRLLAQNSAANLYLYNNGAAILGVSGAGNLDLVIGGSGKVRITGTATVSSKITVGTATPSGETITTGGTVSGITIRQRTRADTDDTEAWTWYATGDELWLYGGSNKMAFKNLAGAANKWRVFNLVAVSGAVLAIDSNQQIGLQSSSAEVKTNVVDLPENDDRNPVWRLRPRRFRWSSAVANADAENERLPKGIAGLVADEVAAVAPDAVHVNDKGQPLALDNGALIGYLVAGVQQLRNRIGNMNDRLTAVEAKVP